jgi:hypothetical protein
MLPKPTPREHRGHVENRVLGTAPVTRVLGAERLIGFKQRKRGESECVRHARAPESIELAFEDQRVGGRLIAIPAASHIELIDAEWAGRS